MKFTCKDCGKTASIPGRRIRERCDECRNIKNRTKKTTGGGRRWPEKKEAA